MSYVTVGGVPCSSGSLTLPLRGTWLLEVELSMDASDVADGDPLDAVFGDLALHGSIYRAGNFTGQGQLRVVGGNGGWRNPLPPKFYGKTSGLKAAEIVADCAKGAGEVMAAPAPGNAGRFWVRPGGAQYPASFSLNLLCPDWWVDLDGRTWPSARPGGMMVGDLNVVSEAVSLSEGVVRCSPEHLAGIFPGMDFVTPTTDPRTCVEVVHRVTKDRVRTELWVR